VTRISRDGITAYEFFYDIDKKLYRMDFHFLGSLASYYLYDYNENGIKESRRYNADDHNLNYKTVFTLDNFGRIVKAENYSDTDSFEEVVSLAMFEYNGSGQLTQRRFSADGATIYNKEDYTYDTNGTLIKIIRTYYPNQAGEYVGSQYDFTPSERSIPVEWKEYLSILDMSSSAGIIREMFNSDTHYEAWNDEGETTFETQTSTAQHVFDEDGNLTGQQVTQKNLLKPQNPDVVDNMTYDFKQDQ
jgi:hypothetical protein